MPHYDTPFVVRTEVAGATPEELAAHQEAGKSWQAEMISKHLATINEEANEHAAKHGHKPMTITLAK